MNVRNCRSCGRIFNYVTGMPICQACREKLEEKFQEVKEYIRAHKGVGVTEVAEACDVDPEQLRQWLKDDRLEVTEDSAIFLECEICGASIRSGKYCEKCKLNMSRGFHNVMRSSQPEPEQPKKHSGDDSARMRFLK